MKQRTVKPVSTGVIIILALLFNISCRKEIRNTPAENNLPANAATQSEKIPQSLKDFTQVNLVRDTDEDDTARVEPALINAWGIAFSPGGIAWISAEGSGKSVVVNKDGAQVLAPVSIPSPVAATGGHPTGIVFSGSSTNFRLPNGNPARFIFAGADGVISAWNSGSAAIKKVDNSATAAYLGLAIASDAGSTFLYAANFRAGTIDVFNSTWAMVSKDFIDPALPQGYSPFNIQAIDNQLYVMYAKVGADGEEDAQPGLGLVDIFNPNGSFVKRFISHGQLNAPWGITKAPAGFYGSEFGSIPNTYLVGNFGDGRINAYTSDGTFLGQLRAHGNPIVIDGLWALSFSPSSAAANRLYFTAGPDDEEHGLFGYIIK